MTTIVKFRHQPLNFWTKPKSGLQVASVVVKDAYATGFPDQARALEAVKKCELDETQITYHVK